MLKPPKIDIHGVSAMDDCKLFRGRPNGGAVILWNEALIGHVNPIPWESKRLCAVTYDTGENITLIICVYMPCDDWRHDGDLVKNTDILNLHNKILDSQNFQENYEL